MADIISLFSYQNYFLNPFAMPPLLTAVMSAVLGLYYFRTYKNPPLNQAVLIFCASICAWLLAGSFLLASTNNSMAAHWSRLLFSAIGFAAAGSYHLSAVLSQKGEKQRNLIRLVYAEAILLAVLTVHRYYFSGVGIFHFGLYPTAHILTSVLVIYIATIFIISFINFLYSHAQAQTQQQRRQIRFLMMGFAVFQLCYADVFVAYGFNVFPIGYVIIFGSLLTMACFLFRNSYEWYLNRSRQLEEEMHEKSKEMNQIVKELRETQLKLLEAGRMSAVASLSAGIMHQISQPITAIHGFAKFLKKEMNSNDAFYRPICLIAEQTTYLKQMLEDLMGLVRHREIVKENININETIMRSMNLLKDELRIRRVNWNLELGENLPLVYADSIHLQQIFMNIMSNAIQALATLPKDREKILEIRSLYLITTHEITITFRDSGPGMMDHQKNRIFEPFFTTKEKGAGIGLALCNDLIQEHGGTIGVESQPNQGAKFIIKMPCIKVSAEISKIV